MSIPPANPPPAPPALPSVAAEATPPVPLGPASRSPLASPAFRRLLVAQAVFGVAFSIFLILPKYLATHLGASTGLIGWIMASAALANVVTAPLLGRVAGPAGARRGMVIGNLAMTAGALLFVFVATPGAAAFLARALQGLGWALVFSSAALLAVALAPPDRTAQAIGLHGSANLVTNAIGPALAEPILATHGPAPVFAAAAVIALAAAALSARIPLPPRLPAPASNGSAPLDRLGLRFLVVGLVLGVACGVMFILHQPLALSRGITRVSGFLIAYTITSVSIRLGLGRLSDRVGAGRVAMVSFIFYGVVVAATPTLTSATGLVLFGALFGVAHGLFFPSFLALAIGSAPERARARVIAGINAAFNVGSAAVIPFAVVAERQGFAAAFLPVGLCTSATALLLASRRTPG